MTQKKEKDKVWPNVAVTTE